MKERTRFEEELRFLTVSNRLALPRSWGRVASVNYEVGADQTDMPDHREREMDPTLGNSLYLPIRLNNTVPPKVGVFIPGNFKSTNTAVDLIVYFHGHIIADCKTDKSKFLAEGMEYYWNTQHFQCLRQELVASGQNAILLAPTFVPIFATRNNSPSDYGDLDKAGKFDFLIDETLKQLKTRGMLPAGAQVRNIILSGHSGGGLPMQAILSSKNSLQQAVAECWGFECLYFGTTIWDKWLSVNPGKFFRHFRRGTKFVSAAAALKKYKNFIDGKDGTDHCLMVKEKWRQAIDGSRVFQGNAVGSAPRSAGASGSTSGLFSLLTGLPGLAALPMVFISALLGGLQDENHLTNLIFFTRHPELGGRKLAANDPQSLKDEWVSILKTVVRPAISRLKDATAGSKVSPTASQPVSSVPPLLDSGLDNFVLTEWKLATGKIVVARAGKNKTSVAITEAPSIFLPEIIGQAKDSATKDGKSDLVEKLDPAMWFRKFTRITFLGRPLKSGQYLHLEMAKLLKGIERELIKKYGGNAGNVGDMLLNKSTEGISGSRLVSSTATFSMHMFGLAVDVNYLGNPFIETQADRDALNNVLKNAALLMNEAKLSYRKGDGFDTIQQLDSMLETYFSLLDKPVELARLVQASSASEWHGLAMVDARTKIQKNLDNLAGLLARGKNKDYFKKHAILDFDKRFVVNMETLGLSWGGKYGDMMHFDMRKTGVGFYIEKARLAYSKKVKDLAAKLLDEKRYGTHSP